MKGFLNRIARSIIATADVIARLTEDQPSDKTLPRAGRDNEITNEYSFEDKEPFPTEVVTQPKQVLVRSGPPASNPFSDPLSEKASADQSQTIVPPDDSAAEPEASPEEHWISFAYTTDLVESDIYLDTTCTTGPGLNEIDSEESPLLSTDGLNDANVLLNSGPELPADTPAAAVVGGNPQVASGSEASSGRQYLGFDISLSDLEKRSESTWQEDSAPPYASTVQPEPELLGLALFQEAVQEIERGQGSLEFDLTLTDLEDRQQSTWYDSPNNAPAEKSTNSPTNVESGINGDHKSRLDSQVTSFSQQASTQSPGIKGAANLHEAADDYWVFRRIQLRPDGLQELQLRQSGALAWDLRWDPEDYIWALDGVGYFDNIWNVEGFFESMVGEAEDRCQEALYWPEYQDE
jgi:hypothetical protein